MSQAIDEIMDHFDFARVETAMQALDWQWFGKGVPTQAELRQMARRMLREVDADKFPALGSGGLYARKDDGVLSLSFVLEDWSAGDDE